MADKGRTLPKFGEWDVNDPASAEGFTVIFNKARNERKSGATAKVLSPPNPKHHHHTKSKSKSKYNHQHQVVLGKPQSKKWFCCTNASAES